MKKLVGLSLLFVFHLIVFAGVAAAQGTIAFTSGRDGNFEIYAMNADGTNQTRLTNNNAEDFYPHLSPDGTKIVFYSDISGGKEIYVMNVDGTNLTRLTDTTGDNLFPSFSPDGSKIAFSSTRTGDMEIYIMDANGANQTRITNITGGDRGPSFSPDGSKIVFESYRNGFCSEIFVMNANGTNPIKLTDSNAGQFCDSGAHFNPAGDKITFHADREFGIEVYVMGANGSNLTRLTDSPGSSASFYSSFSPDGSKIIFASSRDGDAEIYLMNPDGTTQTRLTNSPGSDLAPSWSVQANSAPTISANTQSVTRHSSGSFSIASVNDVEDVESTLSVTVDGGTSATTDGVTVLGIAVSAAGSVTATISTTCGASDASFTLRVTDSGTLFAEAALNVSVTAETEDPVLSLPSNIVTSLPLNSTDVTKIVEFTVSATDNCDAAPQVVADPPSGSAFPVGTTTVNVTATDASDNTATGSFTVTVLYNFTGFFQPVDNLPAVNGATAGQAIPVKFSLSGNKGLNIFAAGSPVSQQINCVGGAPVATVEETVTAGSSSLSYDAATDTYIYVWKTQKSWRGTCRQLIVQLGDGTLHVANFSFR